MAINAGNYKHVLCWKFIVSQSFWHIFCMRVTETWHIIHSVQHISNGGATREKEKPVILPRTANGNNRRGNLPHFCVVIRCVLSLKNREPTIYEMNLYRICLKHVCKCKSAHHVIGLANITRFEYFCWVLCSFQTSNTVLGIHNKILFYNNFLVCCCCCCFCYVVDWTGCWCASRRLWSSFTF